ncbi:patatin-like phospholipase family protein [Caballeronia cordobensis]|uniref:patatin-like phospholipase family protein n=1 Tax=Caballeronia cordobensis TaxID=1353886 RepID=UPI00045EFBBD|nr:uncharacterized protein BRPE67_DCDS03530 [Burkholderia sp. RPE67]
MTAVTASRHSPWLDWLVRKVSPAMPWLFLALRRALIPTVCLVILAALFYLVPQSREVLLGLTEPPQTGPLNKTPLSVVNWTALLSYYVASSVLALAVWYSARLLCTVEAWLGMPVAWKIRNLGPRWQPQVYNPVAEERFKDTKSDGDSIRRAIKWLPRAYGVLALSASMGALIFATLIWTVDRGPALSVTALAIVGPLLFVWGVGIRQSAMQSTSKWMQRAGMVMAAGIVLFCVGLGLTLLFLTSKNFAVWLVDVTASLLPAVLLAFVLWRRTLFTRWFDKALWAESAVDFEEVIGRVALFSGGGLAVLVLLAELKAAYVRSVGSAATVMIFLAAAVLFIAGLQLFLRRVSRSVPGLTSAAAIILFVAVSVASCEPLGKEGLKARAQTAPVNAMQSGSAASLSDTLSKRRVIINAYGGGLRAAIYTAQVLARADDASCGEFGKHIVAMSGVSGGSLGIAVYLVARQQLIAHGDPWAPCEKATKTPLTDVVARALGQDHLSPVIARTLSLDLFPLGDPERGQAILDSWNDALADALKIAPALAEAVKHPPPGHDDDFDAPLAMKLADLNGGISPKPLVFFNTTDADSGNIVWFSNGAPSSSFDATSANGLMVGQAVLHSARFPIVTPAGEFMQGDTQHRLVDGGYADNSGAQTLSNELGRVNGKSLSDVTLIDIDGNPPAVFTVRNSGQDHPCEGGKQSAIPTALLALLQARSAHAEQAVKRLPEALPACTSSTDNAHCLEPVRLSAALEENETLSVERQCAELKRARTAPLGWYTGNETAATVALAAYKTTGDLCLRAGVKEVCISPKPRDASPKGRGALLATTAP